MVQRFLLCGFLLSVMVLTGCSIEKDRLNGGLDGNGNGSGSGLYLAGWIRTGGGTVNKQNSFYKNIGLFNEINPVWYDVVSKGNTEVSGNYDNGTYDADLYTSARQRGIKIIPTLQNVANSNGVGKVNEWLASETLRQQHVAAIVKLVNEKNFDGIDIDYEGAITNNNHQFDNFIALLSTELAKTNKLLSVCVNPPTNDYTWQNWPELLKYVDSLKVMVYNCDSKTSPGPICTLDYLKLTLRAVQSNAAAKGKVIIGLPFYGRHWFKESSATTYTRITPSPLYTTVQSLIQSQGITADQILRKDGEAYFTYQDTAGDHLIYFQDALALQTRLKVIAPYLAVIKGVTFWELGGEDPASWDEIAKYK